MRTVAPASPVRCLARLPRSWIAAGLTKMPWLPLLGALVLLLAAACNRGGDDTDQGSAAAAADLPRVGDFEIVAYQTGAALTAERMQFSAVLDQGKPVVLNFWAGLCPPCRAEMPEFQEVYDEYQDRIVMLGIDLGPFTGLGSSAQGPRAVDTNWAFPIRRAPPRTPTWWPASRCSACRPRCSSPPTAVLPPSGPAS